MGAMLGPVPGLLGVATLRGWARAAPSRAVVACDSMLVVPGAPAVRSRRVGRAHSPGASEGMQ